MNFLLERLHRSQYAIVSEDDSDRNENDREVAVPALRCNHSRSRLAFLTTSTILVMIAGVGGFLIGVAMSLDFRGSYMPVGTVPQVPIGRLSKNFQYNETFAAVPSTTVTREPVWDSLLPNGLGYVRNPSIAPNLSVIGVFHQLHCLYTLRRAYYSTSKDKLEDFDFGIERAPHTAHCFEYLRQSVLCSADSSIEPAGSRVEGFLGWGFQRQCNDYRELKDWAEQWRAFDGYGFIATPPEVR